MEIFWPIAQNIGVMCGAGALSGLMIRTAQMWGLKSLFEGDLQKYFPYMTIMLLVSAVFMVLNNPWGTNTTLAVILGVWQIVMLAVSFLLCFRNTQRT